MKRISILLFILIFPWLVEAQVSVPAKPASQKLTYKRTLPFVELKQAQKQVMVLNKSGEPQPLYAGSAIRVDNTILSKGVWDKLSNGGFVWRLEIRLPTAQGINLSFKDVKLAKGDKLFIYSPDKSELLGAYTAINNSAHFGTEYIRGNEVVLEFNTARKITHLPFSLVEVGDLTNIPNYGFKDFGDAGSCEVPVNCPEGDAYQKQKRGVARILLKDGSSYFWCTGSLINDTKNDGEPYLLTANHCGETSSSADYAQWIFYFNYESKDCNRPLIEPTRQSVSGARLLASAVNSTAFGSDFKLLMLDTIPLSYKPYFNGWDKSGTGSPYGVVIHHPEGDIKMISTYSTPLMASSYYGSSDPNGLYWTVHWAATASGHGVTEGGSSGSPLFSNDGLIVGTLTGGGALCSNQTAADYFGRFSKDWLGNGSDSTQQLQYWLDDAQSGLEKLSGLDPLLQQGIPEFSSDVQSVPIGGTASFFNLSLGPITAYHWEFEGGDPATSNLKTPPPIRYDQLGDFRVSLSVSYATGESTKVKQSYISVRSVIFPNPTQDGKIKILLGSYKKEDISFAIYNSLGQPVRSFNPQFDQNSVTLTLPHGQNGLYFIRLTRKGVSHVYKILNFHR